MFQSYPIVFIDEPVHEWEAAGFLQALYDGKMSATAFQNIALSSVFAHMMAALNDAPNGTKLFIAERSIDSNLQVFGKASASDKFDLHALEYVWNNTVLALPSNIQYHRIMLKAFPASCMTRIQSRARDSESAISMAYLKTLHDLHGDWMYSETIQESSIDWHIIDAEQGKADVLAQASKIIIEILAKVQPWRHYWITPDHSSKF